MSQRIILGIHVLDRAAKAAEVQQLLTEFGCHIKTRIGLHEVEGGVCSPTGIILLEIHGGAEPADALTRKLTDLGGVAVQRMVFEVG